MYRIEDIPIGRDKAISRRNLAAFWGVSDRKARQIVSALRTIDDGTDYVIVSNSRFSGYYRTRNTEEIEHFINDMLSRIKNVYKAIKTAKRILRRLKAEKQHGKGLAE